MTNLIEYNLLPRGDVEPQRVIEDSQYLKITKRGGSWVLVNSAGDSVMNLGELDEEHRIKGEVRFG